MGITVSRRQTLQCLIEYADTAKGTVLEDEIVDATKVSFGLDESWTIFTACKATVSETIGNSKEHVETTKRRADRFRHSGSPDCEWGRRVRQKSRGQSANDGTPLLRLTSGVKRERFGLCKSIGQLRRVP